MPGGTAAWLATYGKMPIRINCKHCGKKFSAWDDLVGKSVQCPKCQKKMTVPGGDIELPTAPSAEVVSLGEDDIELPTAPSAEVVSLGEDDIVAPPVSSGYEPLPNAATGASEFSLPMPSVSPAPKARAARKPASTTAPAAASDDLLDDGDDLPFGCPNCSQPMPPHEDLCDHCGYHRILKRKLDISEGIAKPDKTTGFERMFRGQLEDADSADGMLKVMKVVAAVAAFALVVALFICGGLVGALIGIAIIGGAGFFLYRQRQSQSSAANDSAMNQDAFSAASWGFVLFVQRAAGWRLPQWPFPKTKALILHDRTFTDEDLAEMEELPQYQTLDLEGTQLSNDGLKHLERHKQLRYLVVRGTNVTAGGVQQLQQALPEAWIWF